MIALLNIALFTARWFAFDNNVLQFYNHISCFVWAHIKQYVAIIDIRSWN